MKITGKLIYLIILGSWLTLSGVVQADSSVFKNKNEKVAYAIGVRLAEVNLQRMLDNAENDRGARITSFLYQTYQSDYIKGFKAQLYQAKKKELPFQATIANIALAGIGIPSIVTQRRLSEFRGVHKKMAYQKGQEMAYAFDAAMPMMIYGGDLSYTQYKSYFAAGFVDMMSGKSKMLPADVLAVTNDFMVKQRAAKNATN